MNNSTPKQVWIKNKTNGLIYQVWEHERHLCDPLATVPATDQEVEAWQSGTYWSQYTATADTVVEPVNPTKIAEVNETDEPKATVSQNLDGKTKAELLEMLRGLDPETKCNEKTTNAEIIEAIEVFQTLK